MCISIRRNRAPALDSLCQKGADTLTTAPTKMIQPTASSATTRTYSPKPQARGIRFSPSVAVHELLNVPASSVMTADEKANSWYSIAELESFKTDAREAGRRARTEIGEADTKECGQSKVRPQHGQQQQDVACSRGLEQRISAERQRNKYFAIRAVIECHRRHRTHAHSHTNIDPALRLAAVSIKMTGWAAGIARNAARDDFAAAYPEIAPYLDVIVPLVIVPQFPALALKRRPSTSHEEAVERRVRRRVSASPVLDATATTMVAQ